MIPMSSIESQPLIHPRAIVDKAAEIDSTVEIGPNVVIDGPVRIGARTRIMANAHISGNTIIGEDNEIHVGAVVGNVPQHLDYKGGDSGLVIGNGNAIREYVTIHRAYHPGQNTVIGDHNLLMATSHVAHDVCIGNHIIMGNGTLLAGHTTIYDRATISGNVAIHQYVRVGSYCMIGGLSKIVKDVPPFMMVDGDSQICGLNTIGLRRNGFSLETREKVKQAYRILYRSGLNVPNAVKQLQETLSDVPEVKMLIEFIQGSVRGISKHTRTSSEE